jgi:MFS family permease
MTDPVAPPSEQSIPAQHRLQRRTLGILTATQMIGGTGIAIGIAVGALLAAQMAGTALSGLAQSSIVVGTALFALPVTRLMNARGRRPGLGLAYLTGAVGAAIILFAAWRGAVPLLFVGMFLLGAASTANLQARYAAVDLAEPAHRGRQLSLVVWATTIGSVAGPSLADPADKLVHRWGAAPNSGPFLFSVIAFVICAVVVLVALRPDPLLTARTIAAAAAPATSASAPVAIPAPRPAADAATTSAVRTATRPADPVAAPPQQGFRAAAREVAASPSARLGLAAMAVGHVVMVSVMTMTPVHIREQDSVDALRVVGLVLSAHIAGMYALSPLTGWLADRIGRRRVILGGIGLLVAACAVAGLAGHDTVRLTVGLCLLGLGWSGTMVAGSTLFTESVGSTNRTHAQGFADLVMGLGAASGGALAGLVVAWSSYATLTAVAAVVTVPLLAAVLRPSEGGVS